MSKIIEELEDHWKGIIGSVLGIIVVVFISIFIFNPNQSFETITASEKTLIREIRVAGEIVPAEEVTLGFTKGGRVTEVFVDEGDRVAKGDIIARLDTTELNANLREAVADRSLQQAELEVLVGGSTGSGQFVVAKQEALSIIEKAYSVADNQIKTRADIMYENPQSGRPQVTYAITSFFTQRALSDERRDIGILLEQWNEYLQTKSVDTLSESDLVIARNYLTIIREYFMSLAEGLSSAEPVANTSEANINEFRTTVSNAQSAIDTVIEQVVDVQDSLQNAGATIPVQQARIQSSDAIIDKFQSQLSDTTIRAPFGGVIVAKNADVGEVVAANQTVVELITDGDLFLEAFIPEVQLRDITVGDIARFTLDAYGPEITIVAEVSGIDIRATTREGVATYKTTFALEESEVTLRAGMTADIFIEALVVDELLLIPSSIIFEEDGNQFVYVQEEEAVIAKPVVLGREDSYGNVEIESGIKVGEKIVTNKQ